MSFCVYCLEKIPTYPRKATCGRKLCRARTTAWNAWVRPTRKFGDVNKPIRRATRLPSLMNDDLLAAAELAGLFERIDDEEREAA
jgi:hypothetical protein